jgi:ribosomal silencing factor RsfS
MYTEENHKAYLEAMEDLKNGDVIELDFEKIKTSDDFIKFLDENEV